MFDFCLSSNNWFRRLEEVILRTDGWKKHSRLPVVGRMVTARKRKFKLFGRSNIWLA